MSSERPEEFFQPPVSKGQQIADDKAGGEPQAAPTASSLNDVKLTLQGEAVLKPDSSAQSKASQPKEAEKSASKTASEAKLSLQRRLPALDDDAEVGVQKDHVVTRDGKADLAFSGTLLASAALPSATQGYWWEYRVYRTSGGKHVFSKVRRSIYAEERDEHKAEVFDPAPTSMPSQLLRGARDLVHSEPMTWKNAAADFFGYDPLAKILYRKLGDDFEEHIA